jgi:heptosyltransferase-2
LGGKEDYLSCERIQLAAQHPDVENLAGRLSFLESAALMREAAMNYANDSAPVHIASAVNAPTVAVFCSTIPGFGFAPLSDINQVVETPQDMACRPCGLHGRRVCPKGHFNCAESIPIESIRLP